MCSEMISPFGNMELLNYMSTLPQCLHICLFFLLRVCLFELCVTKGVLISELFVKAVDQTLEVELRRLCLDVVLPVGLRRRLY